MSLLTQVIFENGPEAGDCEIYGCGMLPKDLLDESCKERDCDSTKLYITPDEMDIEMFYKIASRYDIPVMMGMVECNDYKSYKKTYKMLCPILEYLSMVE